MLSRILISSVVLVLILRRSRCPVMSHILTIPIVVLLFVAAVPALLCILVILLLILVPISILYGWLLLLLAIVPSPGWFVGCVWVVGHCAAVGVRHVLLLVDHRPAHSPRCCRPKGFTRPRLPSQGKSESSTRRNTGYGRFAATHTKPGGAAGDRALPGLTERRVSGQIKPGRFRVGIGTYDGDVIPLSSRMSSELRRSLLSYAAQWRSCEKEEALPFDDGDGYQPINTTDDLRDDLTLSSRRKRNKWLGGSVNVASYPRREHMFGSSQSHDHHPKCRSLCMNVVGIQRSPAKTVHQLQEHQATSSA